MKMWLWGMCLLLCACSESGEQSEESDRIVSIIDSGGIPEVVSMAGGAYDIRFSSRESWFVALYYANSDANWISAYPMSGGAGDNEIRISIQQNTTPIDRQCFVRIMAGDAQKTIEVRQAQHSSISLSPQQFWLGAEAGEFQVQVQANVEFEVKIEDDWIELVSERNKSPLTFKVKVNPGDTRTGTIVVSGGGVSAKAEVVQYAPGEIIHIPDANFKSYLMQFDKTKDGEISRQEALAVQDISCNNMNIESLEGIEFFTNLTKLNFSNNQVRRLDLSHNTKLASLNSRFNPLEWINFGETLPSKYTGGYSWGDVPHFEALTSESFQIVSSKMTILYVRCEMSSKWDNINLRVIDISGCPALELLWVDGGNPVLQEIWLKKGQATRVSCSNEKVQILYK